MKIFTFFISLLFLGCTSSLPKSNAPVPSLPEPIMYPASEPVTSPAPAPKATGRLLDRIVVGEGDKSTNVYTHSRRVLNTLDEVKSLRNTVTYVILPNNISQNTNSDGKKYKRYVQLLELIQELRETDLSTTVDSVSARIDNQFVLFSKDEKSKNVTVKNYNYALAHKVLDFFKENYSYSLFSKEGPYLVTITKDIWTDKENFTFLYVNMSSFNNSAVKEVLESYKERLVLKGNDEVGMFERLHMSLLSFITNLNDDIHIFQSAVAGEL